MLIVMYPQVLILAAAAAAALIKECLSPHKHSHAAVWQITPSLILTFFFFIEAL